MSASPDPKSNADALERLLRDAHSSPAPIADDGFSHRVLHALPEKSRKQPRPLAHRPLLCLAGALVGLLIGVKETSVPSLEEASTLYADWATLTMRATTWFLEPTQLITLGSIAFALGILWLLDQQPRGER